MVKLLQSSTDPNEKLFLETNRIRDFMEKVDNPRQATRRVIEQMLKQLEPAETAVARPVKTN